MEERPKPPLYNIVAGDILYWLCIIAAIICMIGPCISILFPENNVANPYKIFDLVWKGEKAEKIWVETTKEGKYPGPHFWIKNITKGDGITQLGIWLGCSCALPAAFISGLIFLFKREWIYWLISLWVSFMIFFAMLGIIEME